MMKRKTLIFISIFSLWVFCFSFSQDQTTQNPFDTQPPFVDEQNNPIPEPEVIQASPQNIEEMLPQREQSDMTTSAVTESQETIPVTDQNISAGVATVVENQPTNTQVPVNTDRISLDIKGMDIIDV